MSNDRVYYGNSTNAQKKFIEDRIYRDLSGCQSMLVDDLLKRGIDGWDYEDIQNGQTPVCPICGERAQMENSKWIQNCLCAPDPLDAQDADNPVDAWDTEYEDIYEWWYITDDWVKDKLLAMGEPILDNDYGTWWGRTCTGQAIILDPTLWTIYQDAVTKVDE